MNNAIPNIVTALNLVFGMLAIIQAAQQNWVSASWFILAAMIADGLDGRIARMLGVSSEFGKELDSLCDLVSFGVAPAFMAYQFMLKDFGVVGLIAAILFAICGALRLARFNVNTTTVKGYFMGLPIPAGGCVLATFIALGVRLDGWWFPVAVVVVAYLMVSTVHYPDFKGKGEGVQVVPIILAVAIGLIVFMQVSNAYLFIPFFIYALLGIFNHIVRLVQR